MHSQNDEEAIIADYFQGRTGRLLDVGAYDGVAFSNSRGLLELGWSGALVEPLPAQAAACRQLYAGNPLVSVHECAVGPTGGRATFHVSGMMSTIDASYELHRQKWHTLRFEPIEVEQITLETLWERVGPAFDFVSIDVENYNIDIARQLPAAVWRSLSCLCIEHDGHVDQIRALASPFGLTIIGWNAENLILALPR
jgi:FkbM family methyltransferase